MKNLDVHKDLEISAHDIRRLQEQGRITIDILQVGLFLQTLVYHSQSGGHVWSSMKHVDRAGQVCLRRGIPHFTLKPAIHATSPSHVE